MLLEFKLYRHVWWLENRSISSDLKNLSTMKWNNTKWNETRLFSNVNRILYTLSTRYLMSPIWQTRELKLVKPNKSPVYVLLWITLVVKLLLTLLINSWRKERCLSVSVSILNFILGCLELRYSEKDTVSWYLLKLQKYHQCSVYKIRLMKCLVDRAYEIRNTWIKLNDDLMNIKNRILY